MPSCNYFAEKGWNAGLIDAKHFQPAVFTAPQQQQQQQQLQRSSGHQAPACPFNAHTLFSASKRCGRYDYDTAAGSEQLPVFEVGPVQRSTFYSGRAEADGGAHTVACTCAL